MSRMATITRVREYFKGYEKSEGVLRNEFAPHWLLQSSGNMNGWLVGDEDEVKRNEVDSDLESTASSKPAWEKKDTI
ncbi:hypothetical protein Tco_0377648 [Tanacetum coccineum]